MDFGLRDGCGDWAILCTSQALLNDFDYSDEDDDREGMRAQELKGMQAREAGLSVEG